MENQQPKSGSRKWIVWATVLLLLLLGFAAIRNVLMKPKPIEVNAEAAMTSENMIQGEELPTGEEPAGTYASEPVNANGAVAVPQPKSPEPVAEKPMKAPAPKQSATTTTAPAPTKTVVSASAPANPQATPEKKVTAADINTGADMNDNSRLVFYVYAGSFGDEGNATTQKDKLLKAGYKGTRVITFTLNNKSTYRVAVNKFESRDEANALIDELKKKGFEAAVSPQRVLNSK